MIKLKFNISDFNRNVEPEEIDAIVSSLTLDEVFNKDFMINNTNCDDLETLISDGGWDINDLSDLVNDPVFNTHIRFNTKFDCWDDMHSTALNTIVINKINNN